RDVHCPRYGHARCQPWFPIRQTEVDTSSAPSVCNVLVDLLRHCLDEGAGIDRLCLPGVGTCLRATIDERDARGAWRTIAGVLMPDHVHLLIVIPDARRLLPVVTAWKRYTARH